MIKAEQAKQYTEHHNRERTLDEVLSQINQLILDDSLKGKYSCLYFVTGYNREAVTKNIKTIKKTFQDLGYEIRVDKSSNFREGDEILSIFINWIHPKTEKE